jgi:hypothetical protein
METILHNKNMANIFFHGSPVGWIDRTGFKRHGYGFSESLTQHNFVYLAASPIGAHKQAVKAASLSAERVAAKQLSQSAFKRRVGSRAFHNNQTRQYKVKPYLYQVEILNPIEIAWPLSGGSPPILSCAQRLMVFRGLWLSGFYALLKRDWLCAFVRSLWVCSLGYLLADNWCDRVDAQAEWLRKHIQRRQPLQSVPIQDGRAIVLGAGGFNLVKDIEGDGDGMGYKSVHGMLDDISTNPARYRVCLVYLSSDKKKVSSRRELAWALHTPAAPPGGCNKSLHTIRNVGYSRSR